MVIWALGHPQKVSVDVGLSNVEEMKGKRRVAMTEAKAWENVCPNQRNEEEEQ
jgi:hypothetical protein